MKIILIVAVLFTACEAISFESLLFEEWRAFKTTFKKNYSSPQEEVFRREIFFENKHKVALANIDFGHGIKTFKQAANGFADMLNHEFTFLVNGFNRTARLNLQPSSRAEKIKNIRSSTFIKPINVVIPDHIDWRELGGVTAVKSQGKCASCYAFSAAGAIEGHYYRKTGVLEELSPQNLVDCSQPYGNSGCSGGLMDGAYEYVRDNFGIDAEQPYPYESRDAKCRYRQENKAADCTGYILLDEGDEDAIKHAVATLGPVSAAIDAGQDSFQFYSDGVYYDPNCESDASKMNHGVLIVGYGTEPNGHDYWIVKNSYGHEWGQGGYIKMARNANNHCGIASSATYPLV